MHVLEGMPIYQIKMFCKNKQKQSPDSDHITPLEFQCLSEGTRLTERRTK